MTRSALCCVLWTCSDTFSIVFVVDTRIDMFSFLLCVVDTFNDTFSIVLCQGHALTRSALCCGHMQ